MEGSLDPESRVASLHFVLERQASVGPLASLEISQAARFGKPSAARIRDSRLQTRDFCFQTSFRNISYSKRVKPGHHECIPNCLSKLQFSVDAS